MAKKIYKKLNDKGIVKIIDDQVGLSVGFADSELSVERAKCMDYYNGTLPKPHHDGNSKYVSMDVWNSVESMKAALLEVFSAGNKTVRFAPQNAEDVQKAKVCTEYTDFVLHRQNDIYTIMSQAIHDGLMARTGIVKVFWETMSDFTQEEFENITDDELDLLLAEDSVELIESDTDELGLISGTISIESDASKVCVENIAPEEFLIEAQAKSLDDVNFVAHRTRKTLTELRLEGYPESKLNNIGEHQDVDISTDTEVVSRFENTQNWRGSKTDDYQDQIRNVMVIEAYVMLDLEGSGVAELYKIIKAGNVLLSKEKVSRKPFVCFTPLPIPHSFFGANFAEKVIPTQNSRTVLTRSILDHAVLTNNPRYMVVKGSLSNPRELIDNRVGGIVNTTRPDAVTPMQQAPLNPFIYQTLNLLQEDKEQLTGVSQLSQGLNKDAISKQNSSALVEQLATMSQQRQKIIARNFASQFVKPLYHLVYLLVAENESEEKLVELSGNYVPVMPSTWKEKRDVVIELKLGYGEQERESQKMFAMHQQFSTDPNLQQMYTPQNQYALMTKIMNLNGIKDVGTYLTNPEELPEKEPSQAEQMQMQMAQKQLEIQERNTAVAEAKLQLDAQIQKAKIDIEDAKAENTAAIQSDTLDLKEAQLAHKKFVDTSELELARKADEITAIASPTG